MGKIKVSVIVPVYNVEKYLDKCLDSLGRQTLKDIEIIVVNDESPDNSQKIIDKYSKKYSTIHGYKKKNGGVSDARNFGIKEAKGEYIAFVDGDDYVSIDMYEKMYEDDINRINKYLSSANDNINTLVRGWIFICIYTDKAKNELIDKGFSVELDTDPSFKHMYRVSWNKKEQA